MKSEHRSEDEETPAAEGGTVSRWRGFFVAGELRVLDAASGWLQRLRHRLAPAVAEDEPRHGSRRAPVPAAAAAVPAPPARPRRMRSFLLIVAALLAGALGGMSFSYHLLSSVIESSDIIIDDLRDQTAQSRKQDARNLNATARYQRQIEENEAQIESDREEIAAYKKLVEDLRTQLSTLASEARQNPAAPARTARTSRTRRAAAPAKTGTCVMSAQNSAADLTRCVEQFNR